MRLEALIAIRYLFSGRRKSVVNIISWISLIGLLISTAALIVVLSVYNGIGDITKSLFSTFDPELSIVPAEGKTFHLSDFDYSSLCHDPAIADIAQVAEETAWITYSGNQAIAQVRGVDDHYHRIMGIDTLINEGQYLLQYSEPPAYTLVVGGEIYYQLGMRHLSNIAAAIHIPKRGTSSLGFSMDEAFNIAYAYPAGYFFIQQDIDRKYILTHIDMVRNLMGYTPDECTSLSIKLHPSTNLTSAKHRIYPLLASSKTPLLVKDRFDQQPLYFKIFRTERLGIYLILSLIILISTLSLVASLSLLIINKRHDIFTMRCMGMTQQQIQRAFGLEGLLICAVAVVIGLALGFLICWIQQQFGLIRMGNGNFVVDAFPVSMRATDFFTTFILVMAISSISVWLTIRHAKID